MSIQVPFNFQPFSVTTRTGSYTIPSGYYAFVTAYIGDGGSFTIDGNTAMISKATTSTNNDVIAVDQAITSASGYTVPSGYYFDGFYLPTNLTNIRDLQVGGTVFLPGSSLSLGTSYPIKAGSGRTIDLSGTVDTGNLIGYAVRGNSISDVNTDLIGNFWVNEGTQLNETGASYYTVTLYANIA